MSREERQAIEQEEEILNYMRQSHISKKNVTRLKELAGSPNERIAEHAALVLEIALIKSYKRRRLKVLARNRRDLRDARRHRADLRSSLVGYLLVI